MAASIDPNQRQSQVLPTTSAATPATKSSAAGQSRPAAPTTLAGVSDPQRRAAWDKFKGAGIDGSTLQGVWDNLYGRLDPSQSFAGLSDTQRDTVQSAVREMVAASSADSGSGSSNTSNGGSSSGSGTSTTVGGANSGAGGTALAGRATSTDASAFRGTPSDMPGSVYDVKDPATLSANKDLIAQTLRADGASDDDIRSVMALAMVETDHMTLAERQAWKDNEPNPDSRVYSPLNINRKLGAEVGAKIGIDRATVEGLNGVDNATSLATAARIAYQGIKTYGFDRYQALTRGGESGTDAKGMAEYTEAVRNTKSLLQSDPALMRDGRRYGQNVSER